MADSTLIIAEAGVNHNGSMALARQLIDCAADAGADAIKFQTFDSAALVTERAAKAAYQVANTGESGSQLAMLRRLELSAPDHALLAAYCVTRRIRFMSTAFDAASLSLLATFDMPALKIPSGDITAGQLLLQAARLRRPLLLSTGMSTLGDIERALGVLAFGLSVDREPSGSADFDTAYCSTAGRSALQRYVTLLHCTTEYPTPPHAVNLRAMDTMRAAFGLPVGYSDHTLGIDVAIAAVARGATVIEKHVTLDRALPGPDHAASLEPAELVRLVEGVRTVEAALGAPIKWPVAEETANRIAARRSLVATRALARGDSFTPDTLTAKRPGTGRSPLDYWSVLGQRATRDYAVDEAID
jgi:N-acetylneuraminate synthase